ncbi:Serine-type D-Ala-D-Ala carboxypeptidase [Caldicellulosiruptor obsidiansis OB47]|uniref:serine-type D-Ala-D-Ala carboxypeptidase n=1 Tax=Caldicellulosiruptor obsidiansis (strain ATCC BAA-2073 / JCM 16842 / OB47) TaxID=608506 RepID=D9TJW4_CALOO|nr:D-alanyl-D-alanine carboxypeptidase family protein [Caldicellulosiruptor obsidiansis]ADL42296.1 Serine-type D-Ala-D-Ala carboxypeptidase [Caldicellulosiruptor obsidiansis OB47]
MRKAIAILILILLLFGNSHIGCKKVFGESLQTQTPSLEISAKSAILVDFDTGKILYEKNSHEKLPPASITKIMTMILICEAIEKGRIKLSDKVVASQNASSLGGSQVYLKENEEMTVEELLKSIAIASANDACVALAEHIAGSVQEFVYMMNKKAKELGMLDTNFVNPYGLDAENHYTSAYDVAIMSRELLKHKIIRKYLTTWVDTIREGKFGLTNTNKLVRFYRGCTGVKTGSTDKAKFCISASALRNGLHLIAVIMGAPDSKTRFNDATKVLDWGFANFSMYSPYSKGFCFGKVKVKNGIEKEVEVILSTDVKLLVKKGDESTVESKVTLPQQISAPVKTGQKIGKLELWKDGKLLGAYDLIAKKDVQKRNLFDIFLMLFKLES